MFFQGKNQKINALSVFLFVLMGACGSASAGNKSNEPTSDPVVQKTVESLGEDKNRICRDESMLAQNYCFFLDDKIFGSVNSDGDREASSFVLNIAHALSRDAQQSVESFVPKIWMDMGNGSGHGVGKFQVDDLGEVSVDVGNGVYSMLRRVRASSIYYPMGGRYEIRIVRLSEPASIVSVIQLIVGNR